MITIIIIITAVIITLYLYHCRSLFNVSLPLPSPIYMNLKMHVLICIGLSNFAHGR
jgi:hypothetical protein